MVIKMKNLKVIFMGTPKFAVAALDALIKKYTVIAVVTQPDKRGHRGNLQYSAVKEKALEHNIKVLQPEKIRKEYEEILSLDADIIITCAYGQIIPKEILDAPKYSCINIHASLLPKLRGGAPIHRSIINGETETGITIMYMNEKMDEGNIILQEAIDIKDNDTVGSIHDALSELGASLITKAIELIVNNKHESIAQDHSLATYAYNLKKEDELVDFNKPVKEVFNQIRGLNPFPGAYAVLNNKIIKFYDVELSKEKSEKAAKITKIENGKLFISCLDYDIIIKELKYEGSKKMSVKDFFNGRDEKDFIGEVFNEELYGKRKEKNR